MRVEAPEKKPDERPSPVLQPRVSMVDQGLQWVACSEARAQAAANAKGAVKPLLDVEGRRGDGPRGRGMVKLHLAGRIVRTP
eukprot:6142723-Pyramimonas_sp.AAC.1